MDYSFFLRGALDLGTRAVGAYERHVTVAEGRLAWDRDRPVFDESLRLPGEHGPHDGPPPPPEAADDFAFHMPAAEPDPPTQDALHRDLVLMQVENWTSPDADVTDLQRAQAEVLIERAKVEALQREVAELKATKAAAVAVHIVGLRYGTPEQVMRSTVVIHPRYGETVKLYTEDWGQKAPDTYTADEDWTRSVYRSGTGIVIEAKPPEGEGRPTLFMEIPEATARWLGGRVLAALDVKRTTIPQKVCEEPKAFPEQGEYMVPQDQPLPSGIVVPTHAVHLLREDSRNGDWIVILDKRIDDEKGGIAWDIAGRLTWIKAVRHDEAEGVTVIRTQVTPSTP